MMEVNPTLKEYLTNYQYNKNLKTGLVGSNVTYLSVHERNKRIQDKLENIKIILKEKIDHVLYSQICKEIEEAKILAKASMDESRATSLVNCEVTSKVKSQNSCRNHPKKLREHKKTKSNHLEIECSPSNNNNPENRKDVPLQCLKVPFNNEILRNESSSKEIKSILETKNKSVYYENENPTKIELLLETVHKPARPLYFMPPKLMKSEYEDSSCIESSKKKCEEGWR